MSLIKSTPFSLILTACLLGFYHQAWSTNPENPANEPIQIEADSLDAQDARGITRYLGNVLVTQGHTQLSGDQVDINHPNRQLQTLTSVGQPARFQHLDPVEQTLIKGHANTIIYYAQQRKIHLIGDAYLEQENTHKIQGPTLIYDMENQTLNAGSTEQQTGRIKMTLTPQSAD
jgi:lipopolysaccharide export system protein LptA